MIHTSGANTTARAPTTTSIAVIVSSRLAPDPSCTAVLATADAAATPTPPVPTSIVMSTPDAAPACAGGTSD